MDFHVVISDLAHGLTTSPSSKVAHGWRLTCSIGFFWAILFLTDTALATNTTDKSNTPTTATQSSITTSHLEQEYQRISAASYHELSQQNKFPSIGSIEELQSALLTAEKAKNNSLAIGLVVNNQGLIKAHLNADALQFFSRRLLNAKQEQLAKELLSIADTYGDDYMSGRVNFELAKYYAGQNAWNSATETLKKIDITNNLVSSDADEAFIILGAALQQDKKHRESLTYYNKIKPTSKQYRIAQLNTAIAYIRQDWWTDAQLAIDSAIAADPKDADGLTNRLYTVLGFSQLQNGFYRNSRESFRKVKLKSHYSNRALLGLGMAALYQEDFVGALNAFNHLKQKDPNDISVLESYLLSSFSLEKLKQPKTATASYSEAINFYEQKYQYYDNLRNNLLSQRQAGAIENNLFKTINADLQHIQPELLSTSEKINALNSLLSYHMSGPQESAIKQLNSRLTDVYLALASDAIQQKQNIINSYLSQSRFGLAKLYDTP